MIPEVGIEDPVRFLHRPFPILQLSSAAVHAHNAPQMEGDKSLFVGERATRNEAKISRARDGDSSEKQGGLY